MYDMTSSDGAPLHGSMPAREEFAAHPGQLRNPLLVPSVYVKDPASAWPHRYLEHRRKSRALWNRFYHQVRHGCENPDCSTPSCLSYQKRSSKGPFRPYTTLSARALATFLASQDYPERNLCPSRLSQVPNAQETVLVHEPYEEMEMGCKGSPKKLKKSVHWCEESTLPHHGDPNDNTSAPTLQPKIATQDLLQVSKTKGIKKAKNSEIKKDTKSFTQALFDTISFKVFEMAEIPEGYSVWAPWAPRSPESSPEKRACLRKEDQTTIEMDSRPYGPLSAREQEPTDVVSQLHNQEMLADQHTITQEAEKAIDMTHSMSATEPHPIRVLNTNVSQRTDEALDTCRQTFSRIICGAIPQHLLTTPCSPFYFPAVTGSVQLPVQPPMALAQFDLMNTAALVTSVRALSKPGAYAESQFLRHLGRSTAAVPLLPFQLGYTSRSQRRIAYATQSLVHVFSDAKCLFHSFEGNLPQSKVFVDFLRIERALRNLLEIDFHPSNLLASLWVYLSKSEQILHSQIKEGRYCPFPAVFHGVINNSPLEPNELGKATYIHVMDIVVTALVALIHKCYPKEWAIMQRLRSSGRLIPREGEWPCSDDRRSYVLDSMDIFDNEMALRLVRKFLRVTMMHCMGATYLMQEGGFARPQKSVLDRWIERCSANRTEWIKGSIRFNGDWGPTFVQYPFTYNLIDWLRAIILKEWDGRAIIPMGSPVWEAAEFLSRMHHRAQPLALRDDYFYMFFLVERLDLLEMPADWMQASIGQNSVHILSYPFLFPPPTLVHYFRAINHAAMFSAYEATLLSSRVLGLMNHQDQGTNIGMQRNVDRLDAMTNRFFVLEVSRENILTDALDQLWERQRREIMKPLKVRLGAHEGEEGVDHGGVQQEFFRLAVAEAFKPEYGMFVTDEKSQMSWFQPCSLEPLYKFELLGLLVSLALYNGLTLPFTFPLALYRNLLGHSNRSTAHIEDGWPTLAKGLTDLLNWEDGDVEDVFMRSYEFNVEIPGSIIRFDMETAVPTGKATEGKKEPGMVNNENRAGYVESYISWLTEKSVLPEYKAFERGFYSCLSRRATSIFTPKTLKLLIEGTHDIDVAALQKATRYDGYSAEDDAIKIFWHIVCSFTPRQIRKLLEFVTASDRIPFGGVRTIDFTIQKNGSGVDGRLPSSSTCFNRLLLPEYGSRDLMEEKLCTAIENSQGFGVV